jgi:hypothetical protein
MSWQGHAGFSPSVMATGHSLYVDISVALLLIKTWNVSPCVFFILWIPDLLEICGGLRISMLSSM